MLPSSKSRYKYGSLPLIGCLAAASLTAATPSTSLDEELTAILAGAGFPSTLAQSLESRLGRPINPALADLGRLLFFDKILALHSDNSCAGCHSPTNGLGDTQPIAIGIQSNSIVGPGRKGPRNQRRSPMLLNDAFYPKLMWNGRFQASSGDPFNNAKGYHFPSPEGDSKFPPGDPRVTHLLIAQAFIPPTELTESAGFTGAAGSIDPPRLAIFDDGLGTPLPDADDSASRNEPIRQLVVARLNASAPYRELFAKVFPRVTSIDYTMVAQALAEFQFQQTYLDAPIDRFARGDRDAMSVSQKRGAILFTGKAACAYCHSLANGLFSDFEVHNAATPQIAPLFGVSLGNVIFDGDNEDEDFGLEQVTADPSDRYQFRTTPLRNLALSPAFFHNGAFARLEDAIRYHLNPARNIWLYSPDREGAPDDLCHRLGPIQPVLDTLDPLLSRPIDLSPSELNDLAAFVRESLLDPRAAPESLCALIPDKVPSGMPLQQFPGCATPGAASTSHQSNKRRIQ